MIIKKWDKKEWSRKYYIKNKTKINRYNSERQKNTDKLVLKGYRKKYYKNNKDKINKICKDYYNINQDKLNKRCLEKQMNYLKTWEGYIPKKTNCQICGKEIFFNKNNNGDAIHFDHKKENYLIRKHPTCWLRSHKRTPETQKIWESCDFGMLCRRCNFYLPTKDRSQYIDNVYKYVHKKFDLPKKEE